jgi:hypothetical protein
MTPQDDMVPEQIKGTGYFTPMDIAPGEVITSPQDDIDELRQQIFNTLGKVITSNMTRMVLTKKIDQFGALIHDRELRARIDEAQYLKDMPKTSYISRDDLETYCDKRLAALHAAKDGNGSAE